MIFGIETSCDDTACAVVDGGGRVLASSVSSQMAAHRPYGGVVPEIASREHLSNWPAVSEDALGAAGVEIGDLDAVAATRGGRDPVLLVMPADHNIRNEQGFRRATCIANAIA